MDGDDLFYELPSRKPLLAKTSLNSLRASPKHPPSPPKSRDTLQRQYAELVVKLNGLATDYAHLEAELESRTQSAEALKNTVAALEKALCATEAERAREQDLHMRELACYEQALAEAQRRCQRMTLELELSCLTPSHVEEEYQQLMSRHRALQANMDLEQNTKALLIDQIETLTKERDILLAQLQSQFLERLSDDSQHDYSVRRGDFESRQGASDSDGSVYGTVLSLDMTTLSPLKDESFDLRRFQFPISPPLPDPAPKTAKRLLLPARLKEEFVLSPLKLAASEEPQKKRYLSLKPHHLRYNSHDVLPVRVEFEPEVGARCSSWPEQELASVAEDDRDAAYMRLSGLETGTKQEIMKLKFELQSLRLHNEKLLSYIGFELQKQKKNIKKLLSKQNLRMEYLDAKLIQKLRDVLINKKRVLRLVLINPGLAPLGVRDEDEFAFESPFLSSLKEERLVRKYKLQTFQEEVGMLSLEDCESVDSDWGESDESVEPWRPNYFSQLRHLLLGAGRDCEPVVDEKLKYKFFTIVIGIMFIGARLTNNRVQH